MKRRLVSMCLAVMLVGGLSLTSMHEVKAAEQFFYKWRLC